MTSLQEYLKALCFYFASLTKALLCQLHFVCFFAEENSLPTLKQQLPELEGFCDSWLDVTTHSETQTLFCADSWSTSLGVAEVEILKLDLRALKSQNPIFFLKMPFNTLQSNHNHKNPVGRIDTLTILGPLWFIIISLVFFHFCKALFSGILQFKGNFVDDHNITKYCDGAPLIPKMLFLTIYKSDCFSDCCLLNCWCIKIIDLVPFRGKMMFLFSA